jgi:alkylation response protein AidB-like acyl-CoA dehydrogenase
VDFELNEDQKAFRQVMREFVDANIRPVAREWEQEGRYPTEIIDGLAEMGLFGMVIPEEYGGIDLDMVSYSIVFEEIARGWMGIAGVFGSHCVATNMITNHGTDEQKQRYLPRLATGEKRTAFAVTEPDAGSDLQGIRTVAVKKGDHYVVNGVKTWITNARHADPLPVLVKTDPKADPPHRGMSMLLIDQDTAGMTVTRDLGKLGYKGPETSEVVLDDAHVPVENLLGDVEGRGLQQVLSALEVGRVNIAARAVGVAQEAFDQSLAYSKERSAFGQPIGNFQAIQIRLADMATEIQAARLLTWWSATLRDAGERADKETGMAKLYASEMALRASLNAMRIHGAYGYSTEYEIERLYRDAPLMAIGEGTSDIMRIVIARTLLKEAK